MNRVTICGRLGRDPEVRTFANGDRVANLRVATSERWKDKQTGERKERTEWHSVAVFGGAAGVAEQYLRKGSEVLIEGKLQTRKWQDQSGQDRYTTEIVVQGFDGKLHLIGGASRDDEGGQYGGAPAGGAPSGGVPDPLGGDEIPFAPY